VFVTRDLKGKEEGRVLRISPVGVEYHQQYFDFLGYPFRTRKRKGFPARRYTYLAFALSTHGRVRMEKGGEGERKPRADSDVNS